MKKRAYHFALLSLCVMTALAGGASKAGETMYDRVWNMPAMTVNLPQGWTGNYEIQHLGGGDIDYTYVFQNPATGQWMQKYPMQSFSYAECEGQIPPSVASALATARLTKPLTAYEVLQVFINYRQGQEIEVIGSGKDEETLATFKAEMNRMFPGGGAGGTSSPYYSFNFKMDVDSAYALLEYEQNGRLVRENVNVFLIYSHSALSSQMSRMRTTDWKMFLGACGGPADQFDNPDDETTKAIFASMSKLPQWQTALDAERNAKAQAMMKRQNDENAKWQQVIENQRQVAQSRQKVLDNRAEAQSRAFNNMTDVIAGVERVESPYGGELKIDYSKNHAWVDANGNLRYSDSSLYDPNKEHNSSGSYLQIR